MRYNNILFIKKLVIILAILFLTHVTPVCAEQASLTEEQQQTLASLKKIDDFPLYEMHYYGDYGFDTFLQQGMQTRGQSQLLLQGSTQEWACTCFAALNSGGELIFGRNFDWMLHPALLLFTDPPNGYASISMVDISYLGYDRDDASWADHTQLLSAPYLPFDGLNERGLAVGLMAVPTADGGEDPQKVTIGTLHVVRVLLDYAKDIEEVLALLQGYNVDFQGGPPVHYLVADATGNSVVIEYIKGEMKVVRNTDPWQVSTNFIISESNPESRKYRCKRYATAESTLKQENGHISPVEAMTLLKNVSGSGSHPTIWSTVYNMTTGSIQVVMGKEYEKVYEFNLLMKN